MDVHQVEARLLVKNFSHFSLIPGAVVESNNGTFTLDEVRDGRYRYFPRIGITGCAHTQWLVKPDNGNTSNITEEATLSRVAGGLTKTIMQSSVYDLCSARTLLKAGDPDVLTNEVVSRLNEMSDDWTSFSDYAGIFVIAPVITDDQIELLENLFPDILGIGGVYLVTNNPKRPYYNSYNRGGEQRARLLHFNGLLVPNNGS